jgi:hypothetical protein
VPLAPTRKVLDVRKDLMRSEDNLRNVRRLSDVIGQGFRYLAVSYGASVEHPSWTRLEFFPDRPVNQFPGWLKDKNSVVISDEFTGSVDCLMGLAGAAGSGAVFDTHRIPIENLFRYLSRCWLGKERAALEGARATRLWSKSLRNQKQMTFKAIFV